MNITFKSAGLDEIINGMKKFSANTQLDSVRAVNKVIATSRTRAASDMYSQVHWPSGYLGSSTDARARLAITKRATQNDVEAVISARVRPTSLARFISGSGKPGDVRVAVGGGVSKLIRGAFVVRLRSGASISADSFNLGLAVRTHKGSSLRNSRGAKQIGPNLYLLYGPSVDQVFQTVREDIAPQTITDLRSEMIRLLSRRGIR